MMPKEDMNIIYDEEDYVVANKNAWLEKFNDIFTDY